ncbi:MAG: GreA/GreB family elongation factor [Eubacteriales bacterium]
MCYSFYVSKSISKNDFKVEYKGEINKITDKNPIGKAALGKSTDDMVEVDTPDGKEKFKIILIEDIY